MSQREQPADAPALDVRLPDGSVLRFSGSFHIGRDPQCEVQLDDVHVSRRHARVSFARGEWTIRDLQSRNGLLIEGERVESAPIGDGIVVTFGEDGPSLELGPHVSSAALPPQGDADPDAAGDPDASEDSMIEGYVDRYCRPDDSSEDVGGRTVMIRRAVQLYQQQQRRKYRSIIAVVGLVAVVSAGYAAYLHIFGERIAKSTFYDMKATDVLIAADQEAFDKTRDPKLAERIARYMKERQQMETDYEGYFKKVYDRRLSEKERLILKVTRQFGECELTAPPEYIKEVSRYIEKWQSTDRYERAVKRAQDRGYVKQIAWSLMARQLPPQFFYLALQESSFLTDATGPPTRWGIARGMWQFIPSTGKDYGLRIGALPGSGEYMDERLNWERATVAAASYIKNIYATDAEASGLLVMASYNWGEHRVIDIVRKMPKNPKERNFWRLIAEYRIPPETYNYVFSIVSAAVIGENPRLFDFPFDNPLAFTATPTPPR